MVTWTQADIDQIKTAIAACILEVEYDGPPRRRLKYQSMDSMRQQLALMEQSVGGTSYRLAATRKGL